MKPFSEYSYLMEGVTALDNLSADKLSKAIDQIIHDADKLGSQNVLYRGFDSNNDLLKVTSKRPDRKWYGMRQLSEDNQKIVLKLFESLGVSYPVFQTKNLELAGKFGDAFFLIPIGSYELFYNHNVDDVLQYVHKHFKHFADASVNPFLHSYKKVSISHETGKSEVIMKVGQYWLVIVDVLQPKRSLVGKSVTYKEVQNQLRSFKQTLG